MVKEPPADGVKDSWHEATPAVAVAARMQEPSPPPPNDPLSDVENSTGPVGVLTPFVAVSVTVAVQTVAVPSVTDEGRQLTLVLVGFWGTLEPSV
jgi:hypothetical protein